MLVLSRNLERIEEPSGGAAVRRRSRRPAEVRRSKAVLIDERQSIVLEGVREDEDWIQNRVRVVLHDPAAAHRFSATVGVNDVVTFNDVTITIVDIRGWKVRIGLEGEHHAFRREEAE